ncbi:MAG TPA: hypothetical protein VK663_02625 [Burkholderiales bacterium]|nr:hypothetical protein [Burkholderiales bacterium]
MKFLVMSLTALLLPMGVAIAQGQASGDKSETIQPSEPKLVTGNESKHARDADARHCLALKTDLLIIRCAEKYR